MVSRIALDRFTHLLKALALVWSASHRWTLVWAFLLVVQGLLPAAAIRLTRDAVDLLAAVLGHPDAWNTLQERAWIPLTLAGLLLAGEVLHGAVEWVRTIQSELVQDYLKELVHSKSVSVDLAFYESSDFFDHLHRARDDAGTRPLALVESIGSLLQNGITLAALGGILFQYGAWFAGLLLLSALPAFAVLMRTSLLQHRWHESTTQDRRRLQYYESLLTSQWSAAEVRLFGLGPHFRSLYQSLRSRLRHSRLLLVRRRCIARLGASALTLIIAAFAFLAIVKRALAGLLTIGDLALVYQAFQRGQTLMRTMFADLGQVYSHGLFIGSLFDFLALKHRVEDPPAPALLPSPLRGSIRFHDVTFRYPGSARAALDGFTAEIPAGKVVAVVGENGAGKSTLLKLLCRFYDPEGGQIELDGVDIRRFRLEEIRNNISILFQFPVTYHSSARDNIGIADLSAPPDQARIEQAARSAGAHHVIEQLPRGYDSILGKLFVDGTELSGGEWQRVALARAFYRRSGILVLDEPTSFMDSWCEADWLERFRVLARGRTAIIITHRFSIAMQADLIYVMKDGRLVEAGSHSELLAIGGMYAGSWEAQDRLRTGAAA
jgi:ATP-binding cassette subfamily B protein